MQTDDAIRKVQSLRRVLNHTTTGEGEAAAAQATVDRLIAKYNLTEEDLVEYEETTGYFGVRLDRDYHRRAAKYARLKKEAEDALYRLVAFLQEKDNSPWRMDGPYGTYAQLDKQFQIAKAQFKKCHACRQMGFDGNGPVTRYDLGWKTKGGRSRPAFLHEKCKKQWDKQIAEHQRSVSGEGDGE